MGTKVVQRGISLFIDDKEIKNNIGSVRSEMKKIINDQSRMTMGSQEYLAAASKLKALQEIVNQHGQAIGRIPSFWQKAKDGIISTGLGVLGGNIMTAIGSKITGFFSGIIDGNAKLSDSFADISKTTGMSSKEVEGLNKSLGKIDTRTPVSDLRNIAVVAGQLGIQKEQVESFTEAIDEINVALGDEIGGGAEVVADMVGKLRNVMGDMKTENVASDLMHIGNALNVLGAAGFATSPVIADFSNRIGGVGIPLGLTSGQVMGLSATLQELNVSTERGGTAVGKILQKMTTSTSDFAKVAGVNAKKFKAMVNTDLMGAFLAVVEGSSKSGDSATVLSKIIKDLDIDGAGASEVFMKLGENVEMTKEKINLATDALKKNDSITSEFNIKNENFAAKWEKTKKMINGVVMEITTGLKSALLWMIDALQGSIKWIHDNSNAIATMGRSIVAIVGVIATYISVSKLQSLIEVAKTKSVKDWISALNESVVVTKLKILWEKASRASSLLLASVQYLLAGNVQKATQAFRLFSATLGASPWGIAAAAVMAIAGALYVFSKNQRESTSRIQEWGEKNKEAYKELVNTEESLKNLGRTISNGTTIQKDRTKALDDYNKIAISNNLLTINGNDNLTTQNNIMAANLFLMESRVTTGIIENEITDALIEKRKLLKDLDKEGDIAGQDLIEEAIDKINKKIASLKSEAKGYKDINGQIEAEVKRRNQVRKEQEEEERKKAEAAKNKKSSATDIDDEEKKKLQELNKEIKKLEDEREIRRMDDTQKEEKQVRQKYAELLDKAKGFAVQRKKIEQLMEDEIFDAKQKKLDEQAGELRKKSIETEKNIAEKIREIKADAFEDELAKDIANNDIKFQELLQINSNAIKSIRDMGDKVTDEDLVTLKNLYDQNSQLLDLWGSEEEKIRKKHAEKQAKDRQELEDKIDEILSSGHNKQVRDVVVKYKKLIEEAKKYGINTAALVAAMNDELDKLNKKTTAGIFSMTETKFSKLKSTMESIIKFSSQGAEILSAYNDLQKTKSDNELAKFEKDQEDKKTLLDKRLKKGLISQTRYEKEIAALDAETENRKKKAANEEAKRQKNLKLAQAGISMASAIIGFLADPGGWAGVALSATAAIVGGIQIANIENTDIEGYEDGGYTNGDRIYRAGENGKKEFISPNWMLNHPVSGPIIENLERFRLGKDTKVLTPDFKSINASFSTLKLPENNNYNNNELQVQALELQNAQVQNMQVVASKIEILTEKMEVIGNYLSDPNNRRAYMSIDDFEKTQKELALVKQLATYGLKKAG